MRLRHSPTSPFVRKVRIVAAMLDLTDRIALAPADTMNPNDALLGVNPIGRVPTLGLDDGTVLVDSRVICDYLNAMAGGALVPADPLARAREHSETCIADGVTEASLLMRYEAMFHETAQVSPRWIDHQAAKVARALAYFENRPPQGAPSLSHVALACALGYRDFRFQGTWRESHPRLVAWLDGFAARDPSFAQTAPPV
ncbi:MAG: glutathione S-transferase [Rhodoblastus sp.]|nr:MAG: glutathione S-transferase [Rhodoblastus sp.]